MADTTADQMIEFIQNNRQVINGIQKGTVSLEIIAWRFHHAELRQVIHPEQLLVKPVALDIK